MLLPRVNADARCQNVTALSSSRKNASLYIFCPFFRPTSFENISQSICFFLFYIFWAFTMVIIDARRRACRFFCPLPLNHLISLMKKFFESLWCFWRIFHDRKR